MTTERLQKLLAAAGYGSRRACEDYIVAGRVRVNGTVAALGAKADPATDKITVDGEPLKLDKPVYIILNKPKGVVSSLNAQGDRDTVRDLVPVAGRLFPVGRLDLDSEGLILLTNDGELTNRLTHPSFGHTKEYIVEVVGVPNTEVLNVWRRGVVIKDEEGKAEKTLPAQVQIERRDGDFTALRVTMREGKKHQIRRVGETLGLPVRRILRVRIGPINLGQLKPGDWRHLTGAEVKLLRESASPKIKAGRSARRPPRKTTAATNSRPSTGWKPKGKPRR